MMIFVDNRYMPRKKSKLASAKTGVKKTQTKFIPMRTPSVRNFRRDDHSDIPSMIVSGSGVESRREPLRYTGDRLIGISIVHKSCLQPIFSQEEATDTAHMRR